MSLTECPTSGLLLPSQFIDQKQALKKVIDDLVDRCVLAHQHLKGAYYLALHARFDPMNPQNFNISQPVITKKLPPFVSNQMVFWVSNAKGICELLWMVTKGTDKKLKVDFNTTGVAYLQAKGAMPS